MKLSFSFPVGAMLAPAFVLSLSAHVRAQEHVAADRGLAPGRIDADPWTRVLYDEPGDGRTWAAGASWKASFGVDGATYYPRVGGREARSAPIVLSPDLVTAGGERVELARSARPTRDGDRVAFDRGGFTERYDLSADSVEQSFVFDSLPSAGDLVLRVPVPSELDAVETSAGLELRTARGRVTYSRAIAFDARGRNVEATTELVDRTITIRVASSALADAELPLVVDPVVGAIFTDLTGDDTFSTDAAFDPFGGVWVVVYERVFSASDHDVIAKMYGSTGTLIATGSIDLGPDSWITPRIADLASAHKFLAVAGVTAASGGAKTARGRVAQPNGTILTTDLPFSVSGSSPGSSIAPDVGGDSRLDFPGFWCVTFENDAPGTGETVRYVLVNSAGVLAVGPNTVPPISGFADTVPSISKTNGGIGWTVTWERFSFATQTTIQAARISPAGAVTAGPFFIGGGLNAFANSPCASSPIDGTERTMVVFQAGLAPVGPPTTTIVALLDGGSVLELADLKGLDDATIASADQIQPSVDSDGAHFLVAYSEFDAAFSHYELFVSDLAVSGSSLQVAQKHLELQPGLGLSQNRSNVAAARTTGSLARRYLTVYDYEENSVDHNVAGRFVDGVLGGPTILFCFGDGTDGPCPCGNSGTTRHGCANSVFASGAQLDLASGEASTIADDAVLQVVGVPPGVACIFFQGTEETAAAVFGDGLFCTSGTGIRLGTKNASPAGVATYPQTGNPPVSVRGAVPLDGGLRTYQVWYRNAASFCTSATFNVSNGLGILWAR